MITAVEAKSDRKKSSSSVKFEFQSQANLPSNRELERVWNHRNNVSIPSRVLPCETRATVEDEASGPASATLSRGWKRILDVTCVMTALPVILPLMLLIVLWVRLVSKGPALFRQERIGQDGKRFVIYKFRSMKMNSSTSRHEKYLRHLVASNSPMIKLDLLCDSRLIPGGCFLRVAGLDELPQLFNVLRGEMSLVGPRPCLPSEFAYFSNKQRERFQALPGLTGNWQVNGKNQSTFNEMNLLDIDYVRNASPILDLKIMLNTPGALLLQMSHAFRQRFEVKRQNWTSRVRV